MDDLRFQIEEAAGDATKVEALLVERVEEVLRPRLRALAEEASAGRAPRDVAAEARHLLELMMLALPAGASTRQRLGPVFTTAQLRRLLPGADGPPVSDERVRQRRAAGRLIGLKTRDGMWVFPAWQFRVRPGRLEPRDDVLVLWTDLPHSGTFDDWTLALWLTARRRDLEDLTPLRWLEEHGPDERLERALSRLRRRAEA